MLKTVCGWASKTWLLTYACCGFHFWPTLLPGSLYCSTVPPFHYIIIQRCITGAQNCAWYKHIYVCMCVNGVLKYIDFLFWEKRKKKKEKEKEKENRSKKEKKKRRRKKALCRAVHYYCCYYYYETTNANKTHLANSPVFPKLLNSVWICCLWFPPKGCTQQALKEWGVHVTARRETAEWKSILQRRRPDLPSFRETGAGIGA